MNIFETTECVVCLDEEAPAKIFAPCGHKCCCDECVEKIMAIHQPCPLCRQIITEVRHYVLEDVDTMAHVDTDDVDNFKTNHRAAYVEKLRSAFTSAAGFIGKGKLARSVAMAACDELETRRRETEGSARLMVGKKVTLVQSEDTLLVTYRPKGKRKDVNESHPFMTWEQARAQIVEGLDGDTITLLDFAAHYPEYYWAFHHHNEGKVEEAMRDAGLVPKRRR